MIVLRTVLVAVCVAASVAQLTQLAQGTTTVSLLPGRRRYFVFVASSSGERAQRCSGPQGVAFIYAPVVNPQLISRDICSHFVQLVIPFLRPLLVFLTHFHRSIAHTLRRSTRPVGGAWSTQYLWQQPPLRFTLVLLPGPSRLAPHLLPGLRGEEDPTMTSAQAFIAS